MLKIILFVAVWLQVQVFSPAVFAASIMEGFIDPKDGKLDASNWLLDHKGFLPIVEIITD
jgi:hypothetical protein